MLPAVDGLLTKWIQVADVASSSPQVGQVWQLGSLLCDRWQLALAGLPIEPLVAAQRPGGPCTVRHPRAVRVAATRHVLGL